ncbi:DNA polymerase III subunit alpha [Rhodovibrio salinarum]|nr:DNA polymerase III subunit alpha [Rhodovibrio salinarum]
MTHADFVHLRVHSAYSLSEGAIKLDKLVALAAEQQMPAVAMTDTNNLFGGLQFAQAAIKKGVQPIAGCQLNLARADADPAAQTGHKPAPEPIVLLAQSETGYKNLMKLASAAHLQTEAGELPHVEWALLEAHADDLICLSGGPDGPVGRLLREGKQEQAGAVLDCLATAFPERLYLELQRHDLPEEEACEEAALQLAYDREIPLVATNEPFFPTREMHAAHDALLCIAEGTYVSQENRRQLTPEHYFKSAAEMRELFADLPEALDNTLVIARRCAYFPEPVEPMLPPYETEGGRSEAEELRAQAHEGLKGRLQTAVFTGEEADDAAREKVAHPYWQRLEHELAVIERMGFPGYFLIVADFIQWAKTHDIPVGPGRGSGAGSVVAWALTITDLDPLRWNLLFERFLNPERVSMPDFDVDFCQDRRDEVITYVQQKYGHDKVAQIITFGKLQARAVVRDVGRVLQMPYGQVDKISKLIPNNPAQPTTLQEAIDGEPMLQEQRDSDETVARLLDIALKLEGLYRHASTHAAGVVIGDRRLDELIPLYRDPRADMPVTQFNMKDVEKAGLVKFDFLGLKTLTVLQTACELIRKRGVEPPDLSNLPLQDEPTFNLLASGATVGVFQLESQGMRDVLKRLKPDRFEDVIAVVALYRPGPMDNIPSYIARKHGDETVDYLHPDLQGVLEETFGIMIYQEQVMQAAQELAGYSLGEADLLRRAMGKKIQAEMDAQREKFTEGAKARGVTAKNASAIFDQIAKFAGYGFNKSHAAAYAMVAYQTAYLKANYPHEFMAATMTYEMANTDKLNLFRQELNRMGIQLFAPDINRSRPNFDTEFYRDEDGAQRTGIRYALAALRNVGHAAMQGLVAERDASGEFRDLADLAQRLDSKQINKRQIEQLACAGAFDQINPNRQQVYKAADTVVRHAAVAASERNSNQVSLFGGGAGVQEAPRLSLPRVDDWPDMERLRYEFDAIGFYLSAHPLDSYGQTLERMRVTKFGDIPKLMKVEPGRKKAAGIVAGRQERRTKTGNKFAILTVSDQSGVYEVWVFSEVLNKTRDLLVAGQPVLLTLEVQVNGDDVRFTAQEIEDLDQAAANAAAGLRVYLHTPDPLPHLKSILAREGRGRGKVSVVLDLDHGEEVEMELPDSYKLSPNARQALKSIPGVVVQDV